MLEPGRVEGEIFVAGQGPWRPTRPVSLSGHGSRGPRRPGGWRLSASASRSLSHAMRAWVRGGSSTTQATQERQGGAQDQPEDGLEGGQACQQAGGGSVSQDIALVQGDQDQPRMDMGSPGSPGTQGSPGTPGEVSRDRRRRRVQGVHCSESRDSPGWLQGEEEM